MSLDGPSSAHDQPPPGRNPPAVGTVNPGLSQAAPPLRAPPFTSHDPNLWFIILEVNFRAHSVTDSLIKFGHACTLLPPEVISQVSDAITSASSSAKPYEDLKTAVLARLQSSVTARLQELLSKEELGNEKPSDLLRRMKRLLGDKFNSFDKTLFTHLFYQRLPPALQRNLFSVKDKLPLNDLAQLADDYMDSIPKDSLPSIANVTSTPDTHQLAQLVSQLTLQVNALQARLDSSQRRRSWSPRHSRSRSRSRDRPTRTPGVCWYHDRFGSEAIKCVQPCTFNDSPLNGTGGW